MRMSYVIEVSEKPLLHPERFASSAENLMDLGFIT